MNGLIRLLVADDHVLVRQGLVSLLEEEPDLKVVAQAGNGEEAIRLARTHQPDLVLLDITMPGLNGLEAAVRILEEHPRIKIMILTMHEEEAFFFEALRSGAAGYLLKGANRDEFLFALRTVFQDGIYLTPRLAGLVVRDYLSAHPRPLSGDPLSPREREVLSLIAQGMTNARIARELNLSLNTVKTHRLRISQKLNLGDRASLVAYAVRCGLLHPRRSH